MTVMLSNALEDLRLADLALVLVVSRHRNVTKAAKELRVTPSHVSRVLDRVEKALGQLLFERTSRGLEPREGSEQTLLALRRCIDLVGQAAETEAGHRGVVVPSFVVGLFLPLFARVLHERIRVVQGGAHQIRSASSSAIFDFAVLPETVQLEGDWFAKRLGALRMGLYARPSFRRQYAGSVTVNELTGARFVCPVYWAGETLLRGEDGFPLPASARLVGDEVLHVEEGLRLAAERDQLVAAHSVVAQPYLVRGELEEIEVSDWKSDTSLNLWSHGTRVTQATVRLLTAAMRDALAHDSNVGTAPPASVKR